MITFDKVSEVRTHVAQILMEFSFLIYNYELLYVLGTQNRI